MEMSSLWRHIMVETQEGLLKGTALQSKTVHFRSGGVMGQDWCCASKNPGLQIDNRISAPGGHGDSFSRGGVATMPSLLNAGSCSLCWLHNAPGLTQFFFPSLVTRRHVAIIPHIIRAIGAVG